MNLPFQIDLNNKVAVVTGGGGVICSTLAKAVAACGAKVAILDLNPEAAEKVAKEIAADGGTAVGIKANVLDKDSLLEAREAVHTALGTCDILINGAGAITPKEQPAKSILIPRIWTLMI